MTDTIKQRRIIDYDPAAADALMKEAGAVKDGSGVWTLQGQQIGGDLYYPISLDAIAPVIAEQLRRAGFKVAPNTQPGYRNDHLLWPRRLVALGPRRLGERSVPDAGAVSQAHTRARSAKTPSGRHVGATTSSAIWSTRSRRWRQTTPACVRWSIRR